MEEATPELAHTEIPEPTLYDTPTLKDGVEPITDLLDPGDLAFLQMMNEPWFAWAMLALVIWSAIWKGLALWRAARNTQLVWFIALLVLNTAGILEILYISFFQKKKA